MVVLTSIASMLRFVLELALLAAISYFGFTFGGLVGWVLGLGLPRSSSRSGARSSRRARCAGSPIRRGWSSSSCSSPSAWAHSPRSVSGRGGHRSLHRIRRRSRGAHGVRQAEVGRASPLGAVPFRDGPLPLVIEY